MARTTLLVLMIGVLVAGDVAAAPTPVDSVFQINTYTTGSQEDPDVCLDADGNFIVVWRSYPDVRGRRFDASGTPFADDFIVTAAPTDVDRAHIACQPDGGFVVTWYESTNSGNKISCSGGQEVFITAAAENIWKAPTVTTVTTSNLAAAVNTLYFLDLSGLTADRNFVLPAGAPGDWIEVKIATGDATYELVIIGDTGISIEGGSAATEWRKAKNTGESFRFIAETATSWRPVGIIPRATELDYVEFTANVSPTATVEGSANTVVTGSAIDYDGSTIVLIGFFSPNCRPAFDATGRDIVLWLFEDGSSVWRDTAVKSGVPSDACLATGYDRKQLTLSHSNRGPVTFRVQADFTGTGQWAEVTRLEVPASRPLEHRFPDAFGAYWLRLVADQDNTATATFIYE